MPWERRSSPQSALEGRERAGGKILAALQAAGMWYLLTQGIAALSPGLNSPGPLGRLDGRIEDTYSHLWWPALRSRFLLEQLGQLIVPLVDVRAEPQGAAAVDPGGPVRDVDGDLVR